MQWVDQQVAKTRGEVEARVARGDMSPDEAERLIGWRQWQLEQQAAGQAPQPAIIARQDAEAQRQVVVVPAPRPYYAPYPYAPYPPPYYAPGYGYGSAPGYGGWAPGIGICAGSGGRHYGASVCF